MSPGDRDAAFEEVYAQAAGRPDRLPWGREEMHEGLAAWLSGRPWRGPDPGRERAVVVGCGLGNDAAELARRGWSVTAFDVAPSAVASARERHPDAGVTWEVADLFAPPRGWIRGFDLVLEIWTVQSLPRDVRRQAIRAVAGLAAPGGVVLAAALLVARHPPGDPGPPWLLTERELGLFAGEGGLTEGPRRDTISRAGRPLAVAEFRRPA